MYTAVIRICDSQIVKFIETDTPYDPEFDDTTMYVQQVVPEKMSLYCLKARVLTEDGSYEFYNDSDLMTSYQDQLLYDVRQQRNQLIASSDWVMLSDVNMEEDKRQAWIAYRQALRDFPSSIDLSNSSNITWPSPPS